MHRTRLAAAALIPLLMGLAAPVAVAETAVAETALPETTAEPEPPRNKLSPTDDTELPQRTTPPLAPPQPLAPRRINELPKEPDAPRTATPTPEATPAPEAVVKPAIKSALKHRAVAKRTLARKTAPKTVTVLRGMPKRVVTTARPPRHDDSLGSLFVPGRKLQELSPEAAPSTPTYNYLPAPVPREAVPAARAPSSGTPCASRSGTSLSALFTCKQ